MLRATAFRFIIGSIGIIGTLVSSFLFGWWFLNRHALSIPMWLILLLAVLLIFFIAVNFCLTLGAILRNKTSILIWLFAQSALVACLAWFIILQLSATKEHLDTIHLLQLYFTTGAFFM